MIRFYIKIVCLYFFWTCWACPKAFSTEADSLIYQRGINLLNKGDLDDAVKIFESALKERPSAHLWSGLSKVYEAKGKEEKALDALLQALKSYRELGSDSGEAVVTEAIALLHWRQQKPDKALSELLKSLDFKKARNDTIGIARTYISLGNVYAQQERYETAADYFRLSISFWRKSKSEYSKNNLAIALSNLGNVYSALEQNEKAKSAYFESVALKEELGDSLGLADGYNNLGDFFYLESDLKKALKYFRKSKELAHSYTARPTEVVALENEAIVLEEMGEYAEALDILWTCDSLKQVLNHEKYSTDVAELQEKFEVERKNRQIGELQAENLTHELALEREELKNTIWIMVLIFLAILLTITLAFGYQYYKGNELLKKKNQKIEKQKVELAGKNEELQQITDTKDRLFSIIAHNLKGPLSALEGISGLMNYLAKSGQPEKLEKIVTEIDKTAFQTNNLIDNLLNWARTQTQNIPYQPQVMNLKGLLEQCLEIVAVQSDVKNIELQLECTEQIEIKADLNFMKTIMTNLLHNAVKFTPEAGTIDIKAYLQEDKNRVVVEVSDNGVGISADRLANIFEVSSTKSTSGTNGEKGTGLGLYVCKEFVEKEGGTLSVESKPGVGTVFKFTITSVS